MEPELAKFIGAIVLVCIWTISAHALGYKRAMKDALRIYEADREEDTPA